MMSAEIGIPWRSSSARCSNESRSPSISALPPLPDLIPIRKTTNNNSSFIKVNGNDGAIQNSNSNGMANESDSSDNSWPTTTKTTTTIDQNPIDVKPNANELSTYAINNNFSQSSTNDNRSDIDQYNHKTSTTTTTIKQEFHSDNANDIYTNGNANSADAIANNCVSDYTNGSNTICSTVKLNIKKLDGGEQLMHVNGLNNSISSSSSSLLSSSTVMNEKCQNEDGDNNCANDGLANDSSVTLVNRTNCEKFRQSTVKCEKNRVGRGASLSKNGINDTNNKKNQLRNAIVSDIPKRTTRSALDTYECKSRLYTPLPAHYYSVQYARAARKPKRNKRKGKGRGTAGSISKAGRKSKKPASKAALNMAIENAIPKTNCSQTPSKINPIFLFVKRDDTRIVEVRCEDYDKRNRIKLTKTASGWRAIPRTDNPASNLPSTMLPKVMVERLEDSNNLLANKKIIDRNTDKNQSANNNNNNNNNLNNQHHMSNNNDNTWRVNPFSPNRIFISKGLCSLNNNFNNNNNNKSNNNNNNDDDKFDSEYENRALEQTSCSDASTSFKVHSMNESTGRRKHKKKKKKKKAKHKSKMEKLMAEKQLCVSDSNASTSANGSFEDCNTLDCAINDVGIDDDDEGNDKAHAKQIATTKLTRCSATGNASECKFTIRLSKNGESSFIATKKFSTVSSEPFETTEFSAIETTATGIKLTKQKSTNNGSQQIPTDDDTRKMEKHNTDTEMHSVPTTYDRIEMIKLCGSDVADDDDDNNDGGGGDGGGDTKQQPTANASTNVENSNANVLDHILTIDCEKFDTKKEIITPTMSPYHHEAYPSVGSSPQPHHQPIHTLNYSIKMQNVQNAIQIQIQSNISQTLQSSSITASKSETISNCKRNDIDTFASPDTAPVETFDSKLAVKQCIGSTNASAETTTQSNQLHLNDNGQQQFMDSDKLNDKNDDLVDCVDLLDESSYYDDPVVPVNGDCNSNNNNNISHNLGEYHNLIAGNDDDDDDMSGTDLIDSLVERECKNNDITSVNVTNVHNDLKDTICLSDDYNDVDSSILINSQPVVDILSRLNSDTMSTSPKCLSFNEAGEIEGLNENVFSTSKSNGNDLMPFGHNSFDELSMELTNLDRSNATIDMHNSNNNNNNNQTNTSTNDKDNLTETIVSISPDSCEDELPKDLSFKKSKDILTSMRISRTPRPISRDSDTIQSPQPSGLPAVPPSPDILIALQQNNNNRNQNKKQNPLFLDISELSSPKSMDVSSGKGDFLDLTSPISKDCPEQNLPSNENPNINVGNLSNSLRSILKRTLQKEPLDLGHKHRKSASPTVSCSEEVNRVIRSDDNDSLARRIKMEHRNDNNNLSMSNAKGNNNNNNQSDNVSTKDPDPLTQLRLLINNPEWKLPDPILVPKNRLNAVLASPAREIPLLLTTRPELRLPEAFAYPSILQDPDILVISFAQLETIIRKQNEFMKDTDTNKTVSNKQHPNALLSSSSPSPSSQHLETLQRQQSHSEQQNQHQHHHHHHQQSHHHQHQHQPISKERKNSEKTLREMQSAREKPQSKNGTQRDGATNVAHSINNGNLANDINSATLEALNQMFWLPYLSQISQLGQLTPDLMKAMSLPSLAMQQQPGFSSSNPFGLANPLLNLNNPVMDMGMWQEAAVNKAAIQRIIDLNAQNCREAQRKAINESKMLNRNQDSSESIHRQQSPFQLNPATKATNSFFQNLQTRAAQPTKTAQPFLSPSNESQQRQSCNLQSPPLPKRPAFANRDSMLSNQNPFFATPNPLANMHSNFTVAPTLPKFGIGGTNNNNNNSNNSNRNINSSSTMSNSLRKARKEQLFQQQQQQQQQHQLQSLLMQNAQQSPTNLQLHSPANDAANRSCRSLVNLLQQPDLDQMRASSSRTGNMTGKIPSFDLTSPTTSIQTNQPKLRVKPGLHLLDPLAAQRRFLSGNAARCDDSPEIGSTTSGIEDIAMNPAMLNSQAASYTSPWHWTKVTATGE